jgi:hypothetical protein
VSHDFLYDIDRPMTLNHNLANQNWNEMTGGGGGGELILGDRLAKACWDFCSLHFFSLNHRVTHAA